MNGREHIEAGEAQLALADTKTTYSEAAGAHVARAHAHFAAATALFLAETDPAELTEADTPFEGPDYAALGGQGRALHLKPGTPMP